MQLTKEFEGKQVKRPPHWGGYLVVPTHFEFWQGRPSRLHDRFEYMKGSGSANWNIQRLNP
jgi:pyridoxamine 5'-phosphate oxidase